LAWGSPDFFGGLFHDPEQKIVHCLSPRPQALFVFLLIDGP